jgi:hypothetical protein
MEGVVMEGLVIAVAPVVMEGVNTRIPVGPVIMEGMVIL